MSTSKTTQKITDLLFYCLLQRIVWQPIVLCLPSPTCTDSFDNMPTGAHSFKRVKRGLKFSRFSTLLKNVNADYMDNAITGEKGERKGFYSGYDRLSTIDRNSRKNTPLTTQFSSNVRSREKE